MDEQTVEVTGFAPDAWTWASITTAGVTATLAITTSDVYTVNLLMREDGLRIDRMVLTTDTAFIPTGFGPAETERQLGAGGLLIVPITRTIVYTYDNLYRLTDADYSTGENYQYNYDKVGNRLQQIINGDTTTYLYDAANRLWQVDSQNYTFDPNGNLLNTGSLTNTFDAANRLIETERDGTTLEPIYNGVNDRVGQTVGVSTTNYALDVAGGLPEVIYTSEGNVYLHLPGVIMAESSTGEVRYLLADGLGSVRQVIDESSAVVAYNEFDPYGNPVQNDSSPYGFTGEWWENEVGLLHLRARWYLPETGTFLSKDAWDGTELQPQTFNGWSYVGGNPTNYTDPSGNIICIGGVDPETGECKPPYWVEYLDLPPWLATTIELNPSIDWKGVVVLLGGLCYYIGKPVVENWPKTDIKPRPRPEPRPTTTVECCPSRPRPTPTSTRDYQVRVQVQGKKLKIERRGDNTIALRDTSPIKANAVIAALDTLRGRLPRTDLNLTYQAFDRAKRWVRNVAAAGGIPPIGNTPFNNQTVSPKEARVDIEVNRGEINLVP